ncbi:hypothetical protein VPNG_01102 [Cytospora leucostoma]|uniref:Uncharacterized protein n=1 Tax=Cytospora leucostoma TaxID=1230097 RepID=A0A423XM86_9PEZI|nr:hypothetical protein VPNG_01102 [Cytospora leucostoma]
MDISKLPDVDDLIVVADNPARDDLPGMDHARCPALHNYLVHYAWVADGRPSASLQGNNTFFTHYGAAAEALRPRLDPSLAAFLATAIVPADVPELVPFFWCVAELSGPDELFDNHTTDLSDMPADSLVCLFSPNIGQGGESGGGLYYHQGCHRAAVFMHMDDYDSALPIEAHQELWHPLETVLSHWIELLRLGKITASPSSVPSLFGSEKIGPWEWRPYGEAQVIGCVGAWDRLCDAIEARVPSPAMATTTATNAAEQLLAPAVLDAALLPENCFAREFLTRARRPRFRSIAPGLLLPPADAHEFAEAQPFTKLPRSPQAMPPVYLFFTARGEEEADLSESNPFCDDFHPRTSHSPVPSLVPAGVYSESVSRDAYDIAEEGFRLLLPFGLVSDVGDGSAGARKSDGSPVGRVAQGNAHELFQHGYKPFGGDYHRPQRLERLLDHWHRRVEEGVWTVGPLGVEGDIDTFKRADTAHWREYRISPTW